MSRTRKRDQLEMRMEILHLIRTRYRPPHIIIGDFRGVKLTWMICHLAISHHDILPMIEELKSWGLITEEKVGREHLFSITEKGRKTSDTFNALKALLRSSNKKMQ